MGVNQTRNSVATPTELADLLAEDLDVLFCGINPALSAAHAGHHFSNRNNRFWRTLHLAGFTPHQIRPRRRSHNSSSWVRLNGCCRKAHRQGQRSHSHEFRAAADGLERKVRRYHPRILAFLGKPAFAAIFNERSVTWGRQQVRFGGAEVWVLPNPSGLNRAFTLDALVSSYRELQMASCALRTIR